MIFNKKNLKNVELLNTWIVPGFFDFINKNNRCY